MAKTQLIINIKAASNGLADDLNKLAALCKSGKATEKDIAPLRARVAALKTAVTALKTHTGKWSKSKAERQAERQKALEFLKSSEVLVDYFAEKIGWITKALNDASVYDVHAPRK
jgi:hypothetical protein